MFSNKVFLEKKTDINNSSYTTKNSRAMTKG